MKCAYNETGLYNLAVTKEAKRWRKQELIEEAQLETIRQAYTSPFYHPNLVIRILLFVAALFALSGVSGLLALIFAEAERFNPYGCVIYGIASFYFLEKVFIGNSHHFKSGVTEAMIYHACGFIIGGSIWISDLNTHFTLFVCFVVFSFAAVRYLDLVTTFLATLSFAGILFYVCYDAGGIMRQLIPFVFIVAFGVVYRVIKKVETLKFWSLNLAMVEAISLLFIYAAGNYLVVRELSISLMDLYLEEGENIPFAFLFYALTVIIPFAYLYFGIKNKNVVLLRVSLIVIAFSVFTFKYYYSLGHPEITLTLAGAILLGTTLMLFNYLKTIRHGFTRENHLAEKWGDLNLQAFIGSQTVGGNQAMAGHRAETGGGGSFGGGGSTDSF
jgi:hypothetical protein